MRPLRSICFSLVFAALAITEGDAGAADTKLNLAKHRLSSAVASGDIPPQVSGPLYGYYPTRWRAMPSDAALLGDVLPIPAASPDTTRFVPAIPIEGAPPPRTIPKEPSSPPDKEPRSKESPLSSSIGRFGDDR